MAKIIMRWTFETAKDIALLYNSKKEFAKGHSGALKWARKHGYLEEICRHMPNQRISWNLKKVNKIASKCTSRVEFQRISSSGYNFARNKNILDIVCSHMKATKNEWSFDILRKIALKYDRIIDFQKEDLKAYQASIRRGILDNICSHMEIIKSLKKESILKKANNYTYIDFFIRDNYEDYLYSKEKKFKKELFEKMEYFEWDEESFRKEGERYSSIKELSSKNYLAYKWYLNSNMRLNICKRKYWNYEKVFETAQKFTTRKDFKKFAKGAHHWAQSRGFLDEVCEHMIKLNNCFDKHLPATLYYLYVEKDGNIVYKIGITNKSVKERFGYDMKYIRIVREISFSTGKKAYALEQEIIKDFKYAKYTGISILNSGNTEMFNYDILDWDIERRPSEYKFVNNKITDF